MKKLKEHRKELILTFCWLLIMPALYLPYKAFNERVLVGRYGCGCVEGFNTNTITRYVALALAVLTVLLVAVFYIVEFGLKTRKARLGFVAALALALPAALLLGLWFYRALHWL